MLLIIISCKFILNNKYSQYIIDKNKNTKNIIYKLIMKYIALREKSNNV